MDVDARTIRVEWGWDDKDGRVAVKSDAGRRTVPIIAALRPFLLAHRIATAA